MAEKLALTIVRTAGSLAAECILERGIERYMEDRVVTVCRDGVHEREIVVYELAYVVAIMGRMVKIEKALP